MTSQIYNQQNLECGNSVGTRIPFLQQISWGIGKRDKEVGGEEEDQEMGNGKGGRERKNSIMVVLKSQSFTFRDTKGDIYR